ncbi:NAD-dependent epimerase/dehydratase family protein [Candidatus Pelagibacter sp.]|nr:NAD-dependent epimerase/dehydratase family protein [Candidatus Pelagibacter sp.]
MKILITGVAGFIGYNLTKKLIANKSNIITGIDNLNNYYDVRLKKKPKFSKTVINCSNNNAPYKS